MIQDLTRGSVPKTLFAFSLPFLLSCFLQTLYGMVDLLVVGRFGVVEEITAVAVGSQVMHMLTVMALGLAVGSTVLIARATGAGNRQALGRIVGNTVYFFMALSLVLAVLLWLLAPTIIALIATPEESRPQTLQYLRICFCGLPFLMGYNLYSAILRGLGDSKSPLAFVALAGVANLALDLLLVGALKMGPAGAALATIASQALSVGAALFSLRRRPLGIPLKKIDLQLHGRTLREILAIGIPVCCQDGFIQVAFMVITVIANLRGVQDAAAVGIVEKEIGFLFLVPSAMLSSISAMGAQNAGAGLHSRARQTLFCALGFAMVYGLACVAAMHLWPEQSVACFTTDPEVIQMGGEYMRGYVWDCFLAGIHFCFSGFFCAYARSGLSFAHNVTSILVARIPLAYLASAKFPTTLYPMGLATTSGSLVSVILCLAFFFLVPFPQHDTARPPID